MLLNGSTVTNTWDAMNRLGSSEGIDGKTSYQYDENGKLQSVTGPDGSTVGYAYDIDGNLSELTYPDGQTAAYIYDTFGRLTEVEDAEGTTSYAYDGQGRRIRTEYIPKTAGGDRPKTKKSILRVEDNIQYKTI